MSTPVPFSMFVIGSIVFILYLTGYVYMILKASEQQQNELKKETELQSYYKAQKKNRKEKYILYVMKFNHENRTRTSPRGVVGAEVVAPL